MGLAYRITSAPLAVQEGRPGSKAPTAVRPPMTDASDSTPSKGIDPTVGTDSELIDGELADQLADLSDLIHDVDWSSVPGVDRVDALQFNTAIIEGRSRLFIRRALTRGDLP